MTMKQAKQQLYALCKEHGIEIELDRHPREQKVCLLPPAKKHFEGLHELVCTDWKDALDRVKEYIPLEVCECEGRSK